jgi:hypothetical protein
VAGGEPFLSDGWRVKVEKLVLRLAVSAQSLVEERSGGGDTYLVDATRPADVFAPGLRVGPARVDLWLSARTLDVFESRVDDRVTLPGVSADDRRWFDEIVVPSDVPNTLGSGASVLVVLRGERDGSKVTVQAALTSSSSGYLDRGTGCPGDEPPDSSPREETRNIVDVRANDVALARVEVLPEAAFSCGIGFARLALADTNGDGFVDNAELAAAPGDQYAPTLLDQLSEHVGATLLRFVER